MRAPGTAPSDCIRTIFRPQRVMVHFTKGFESIIMSRKQKTILISVFAVIVILAAAAAAVLNHRETQKGEKTFTVEIVSERDSCEKSLTCESSEEYLGQFLRTFEECQWQESTYGIYIIGFDGMEEDTAKQYWWCVLVNGESSTTGADEIPLRDGDVYTFQLKQGW